MSFLPTQATSAPHSRDEIARWQAQLDQRHHRGDRSGRLLVLWEPGDPWEPIGRYFLWQAVDPKYITIEPWVLAALRGPSPRSTGHYCGQGYCPCDVKKDRWIGGASRFIDMQQWRIYQETSLYATRWWVIQGEHGGHRYRWDPTELASLLSSMKGHGTQPPDVCSLPFAPFDARVLRAIQSEKRAKIAADALDDLHKRRASLGLEERAEAERVAKALWEWTDHQAESLWDEGGAVLPRYFEEQIGRAPVGHTITTDYEKIEEQHYERLTDV